ncbi:MAG: helix-turn-helix transcriptional regulator [Proteobacteria bacterium]|nr:helix-turn-helix transcriptional regulator [Pseudomonadota bacterium]MCK4866512.1 helix-turn-helix transcriptional regulator [Alphaproteobacteria bacterium]
MLRNENQENPDLFYREAGEWLRKQRQHWQITQAELAEQAGIGDVALIDGIEHGEIALPEFTHAAIASAFSLDRAVLEDHCETWYGRKIAAAA